MIEPNNPLVLLIPGAPTVSLKNERDIVEYREGNKKRYALIPRARVKKFMSNTRAAITRQLPGDWQVHDKGVAIVMEMHLWYNSAFPRSDVDNFYTTIQECLQNTLVNNDRQIEYFLAIRKRSKSKAGQYTLVFLWDTTAFEPQELNQFLKFKENYIYGNTTELGFIGRDAELFGGTDSESDVSEIPTPF